MTISYASGAITVIGGKDSGTATSGTSTTLTDTGKSWTTNAYLDRYVWIHTGTGAGALGFITGNTATVLTCEDGFWKSNFSTQVLEQVTPDNTSQYIVMYTFKDIADAATGYCTAQGDKATLFTAKLVVGDGTNYSGIGDEQAYNETSSGVTEYVVRIYSKGRVSLGRHIKWNRGCMVNHRYSGYGYATDYWYIQGEFDLFGNTTIRGKPSTEGNNSGYTIEATSTAKITCLGGESGAVLLDRLNQFRIATSNLLIDGLAKIGNGPWAFLAAPPILKRVTVADAYDALQGSTAFGASTINMVAPILLRNSHSDAWLYGSHTFNLINPTWAQNVVVAGTAPYNKGQVNEIWTYDLTFSGALDGVRCYCEDTNGTLVFNATTSSGVLAQQQITAQDWRSWDGSGTITNNDYGPHRFVFGLYGYYPLTESSTLTDRVVTSKAMLAYPFVVDSYATAAARTSVSISGSGKTITFSAATTLQQAHDYAQAWWTQSANIKYDVPLSSTDGTTINLPTGWKLTPGSNLSYGAQRIAGGTVVFNTPGTMSPSLGTTTMEFTASGTYTMSGGSFTGDVELVNTSGGAVTVVLPAGVSYTNTGPSITVDTPVVTRGVSLSTPNSGATATIFDHGTQTVVDTLTASPWEWSEEVSGTRYLDVTVLQDGYDPIQLTNIAVTGAVSGGIKDITIAQNQALAFVTPSGLTYGTDCEFDTGTGQFSLSADSTTQNWYSTMLVAWRTESSLANVPFPIVPFGPNTYLLTLDAEFDGATSIAHLSRGGIAYIDLSGTTTAEWAAFLTSGVPTGKQVQYQGVDGSGTTNAPATGNMDSLVQIYGDASHGSFDHTGHMVFKVKTAGYDQAESDAVATYGSLIPSFYVIPLVPTANNTADAAVTSGVTITDHGASPVTWNGVDFSITITSDLTGTEIQQYLRHATNFSADAFFNQHDLVREYADKFQTVRGAIYGDSGAAIKGVRVVRSDGSTPSYDFDLFAGDTADYVPPQSAPITWASCPTGATVLLYNDSDAGAIIDTQTAVTGGYSLAITLPHVDVAVGDTLRLRYGHADYYAGELQGTMTADGLAFVGTATSHPIYAAWGLDGADYDQANGGPYTMDEGNLQIDISVAGTVTGLKTQLGAWTQYLMTLPAGLDAFYGAWDLLAANQIRQNVAVVDVLLDLPTAGAVFTLTDNNVNYYRSDFSYPAYVGTGHGLVAMTYDASPFVATVSVGGSPMTTDDRDAILAAIPSASDNASATLAASVETGATVAESLRLSNAVLGGKVSGAGTGTETFRDLADTTDRVVVTVDSSGNRTALTRDLT